MTFFFLNYILIIKGSVLEKVILGTFITLAPLLAGNLTVEVTNIKNKNGKVAIGLYNKDDNTFANPTKYYKAIFIEIDSKKVVYTFENIQNGTYAVSVMHDENENGKLDKNILGIPKEGYGFSNNVKPAFRSANFKEAKFELLGNKTVNIEMNN